MSRKHGEMWGSRVQDVIFSQSCLGCVRRVGRWIVTDPSADRSVSMFRVKRPTRRNIPEDMNLYEHRYKPQIRMVKPVLPDGLDELAASASEATRLQRVVATEDGGSISYERLANIYQTTLSKIREDLDHNHYYLIIKFRTISFVILSTSCEIPESKRRKTPNSRLSCIEWIQILLHICLSVHHQLGKVI